MAKNKTAEELNSKTKEELDRLKLIVDLKNAQDTELSGFEIFMKKRVVPIFLPLLTLMATGTFFAITYKESEKSKAADRYKSELELVKMVWTDMKKNDTTDKDFKMSKDFLLKMYAANLKTYKEDSVQLGISLNQRPIMILTKVSPSLQKSLNNLNSNISKNENITNITNSTESSVISEPIVNNKIVSIVTKKDKNLTLEINKIAEKKLKVYMQYSNTENKEIVQNLSDQLKESYLVANLEYVKNKSGYTNEIRYYRAEDSAIARKLNDEIKKITGLNFRLKNIHQRKIKNTIEVWFDNKI
jgi:hypothetical protein